MFIGNVMAVARVTRVASIFVAVEVTLREPKRFSKDAIASTLVAATSSARLVEESWRLTSAIELSDLAKDYGLISFTR
ncbi:hypothetical protein V1477_009034 [Vespula maculifrons]|uniref:Uncharacterized protein n=1 Tax=Vespula maculifrons TaxID=7453 RepID=A0ABD2CFF2_VESMC